MKFYIKKILLFLVAMIIFLGILEVGAFLVFYPFGFQLYKVPLTESPYHPYLGWEYKKNSFINTSQDCDGRHYIQTNKQGLSITPLLNFESPDLKIAVVGGSTMMGVGASDNATTVPSLLEKIIFDKTNVEVEIYNLGVRGYQSFQEMLKAYEFLQDNSVDLVVAVSGRNDSGYGSLSLTMLTMVQSKVDLIQKMERQEFVFVLTGLLPTLRSHSHFIDYSYKLINKYVLNTDSPDSKKSILSDSQTSALSNLPTSVNVTIQNYAILNTISKINKADFVMLLQPTAYTKDLLTPKEFKCAEPQITDPYQREYVNNYYNALRSAKKSFTFFDVSNALNGLNNEDTYVDICHYNDRGSKILAEAVYAKIAPILDRIIKNKKL